MTEERVIHNLVQGTPEWEEFRLTHDGASEAAAMLGLSKKVKRNELLRIKKTGNPKQFSDWVRENILDPGHEMEAKARPIVEERLIGEALYPAIYSMGRRSASTDGITMVGAKVFEHKRWNAELADLVLNDIVPDDHMPQCQQILMVTGAEELYFVVSDGTDESMVYTIVKPDAAWQERIHAGWIQFHIDLEAYIPVEAAPKLVAEPIKALPALFARVRGEVTETNLQDYREAADAFIDKINDDPKTDEEFVQAAANVTFCEESEKALELVKAQALSETASIGELFSTIDHIVARFRAKRLPLNKKVEAEKGSRKDKLINDSKAAWFTHVAALEIEIAPIKLNVPMPNFTEAAKNKRTPESLKNAVDTELANGKIAADAAAKALREKLAAYREKAHGHEFLFADLATVIHKSAEDFLALVALRIQNHKDAEAEKAKAAAAPAPAPAPEPVVAAPVAAPAAPAVIQMPVRTAGGQPLSVGQISTHLGFMVTSTYVESLGFQAERAKGAVLFHVTREQVIRAVIAKLEGLLVKEVA